jgi:hypothetical protein
MHLKNPILVALLLLAGRAVIFSASIGDAISIASIAALCAYAQFLKTKEQIPVNEMLRKELDDMRSTLNALKIAKNFGRLP